MLDNLSVKIYCMQSLFHFPPRRTAIREYLEELLLKNKNLQTARVVDIGCGPGLLAPVVAALGLHYLGIDIDKTAIDYGRRQYSHLENVTFLNTMVSSSSLDFSDDDIIVMNGVAHHLDDAALTVILQQLAPAKYLIICDHAGVKFRFPVYLSWLLQRLDKGKHVRPAKSLDLFCHGTKIRHKFFWISILKIPLWPYFANLYLIGTDGDNETI